MGTFLWLRLELGLGLLLERSVGQQGSVIQTSGLEKAQLEQTMETNCFVLLLRPLRASLRRREGWPQ
jgi:hypothetical protein